MNSQCQVASHLHVMTYLFDLPNALTLPSLLTYIYVTFIFPMEGSLKVHLQFVHSSVLRYIFMYNVMSDFCGASEGVTLVVQVI